MQVKTENDVKACAHSGIDAAASLLATFEKQEVSFMQQGRPNTDKGCIARSFKDDYWPGTCQKTVERCRNLGIEQHEKLQWYLRALRADGKPGHVGQKPALTRFFYVQAHVGNIQVHAEGPDRMLDFQVINPDPFLDELAQLFAVDRAALASKTYTKTRKNVSKAIEEWGFKPAATEAEKFRPKWYAGYHGIRHFVAV